MVLESTGTGTLRRTTAKMRRTRLALCTALALGVMLRLHPATAVDYESDEDTVDVEDVYAHVDALLDLQAEAAEADGLREARERAREREHGGSSSSSSSAPRAGRHGPAGPDEDWTEEDINAFVDAVKQPDVHDADLVDVFGLSTDQIYRLKKKYGLTKSRERYTGELPTVEELEGLWSGTDGLQVFEVEIAVAALAAALVIPVRKLQRHLRELGFDPKHPVPRRSA